MSTTRTENEEVERQINRNLPGISVTTASPFYKDEDYIRVLAAGLLLLVVSWITLSYLTFRTIRANPINALREE